MSVHLNFISISFTFFKWEEIEANIKQFSSYNENIVSSILYKLSMSIYSLSACESLHLSLSVSFCASLVSVSQSLCLCLGVLRGTAWWGAVLRIDPRVSILLGKNRTSTNNLKTNLTVLTMYLSLKLILRWESREVFHTH